MTLALTSSFANKSLTILMLPFSAARYNGVFWEIIILILLKYYSWNLIQIFDLKFHLNFWFETPFAKKEIKFHWKYDYELHEYTK